MISGTIVQSGCSFLYVDSCTDNCLGLHHSDLRIGNSQTAATVTHHRVELMQGSDDCLDLCNGLALCVSQLLDVLFLGRNELMQRRIQETDGYRVALQSLDRALRSRPADTEGSYPELLLSLLRYRSRSSHGKPRFCLPRRTYARYGKDRYPLRQAHEPSWHLPGYLRWCELSVFCTCQPMP